MVNDIVFREPSNNPSFRDPGNVFRTAALTERSIPRTP